VTEPALGEIRLQWWRDALAELRDGKSPRAHPVVEEIAAAKLHDPKFETAIEDLIDASARPLYGEGFSSLGDLHSWLEKSEGAVDALALAVAGADETALRSGGAAFALAREGALLAPNLVGEIAPHAEALWRESAPAIKAIPAAAAPASLHLALTPLYAREGRRFFGLAKRVKLFSAMAFGAY